MKYLKYLLYLFILIFISLIIFENESFFLKDIGLKLNLRFLVLKFPSVKTITLLILFFCLGYFLCYYKNLKKIFLTKKELKNIKSTTLSEKKEIEVVDKVDKVEDNEETNGDNQKEI